jgi:hypothetical protein
MSVRPQLPAPSFEGMMACSGASRSYGFPQSLPTTLAMTFGISAIVLCGVGEYGIEI